MDSELVIGINAKKCSKCGDIKHLNFFVKKTTCKLGRTKVCLKCQSDYKKKWNLNHSKSNKASKKKWRLSNPDYQKYYRLKNKEHLNELQRNYTAINREKTYKKNRKWKLNNLEKYKETARVNLRKHVSDLSTYYISKYILNIKKEQRKQFKPLIEAKRAQLQLLRACK